MYDVKAPCQKWVLSTFIRIKPNSTSRKSLSCKYFLSVDSFSKLYSVLNFYIEAHTVRAQKALRSSPTLSVMRANKTDLCVNVYYTMIDIFIASSVISFLRMCNRYQFAIMHMWSIWRYVKSTNTLYIRDILV